MNSYHGATICGNGHVISSYNANKQQFCTSCGCETYSFCCKCNSPFRGRVDSTYSYIGEYGRPDFCHNCGSPYPWTTKALENARLIIQEEDAFSEIEIESLVSSLPDIITETPGTNLATIRMKKAIAAAGKFTAEGIRQFAIDFGCELAKKSLGL